MKLIAQVKLLPTEEQANLLKQTLRLANEACNYISQRAWEAKTFRQYALHRLVYHDTRREFNLTAQIVVRCIARVANAYKLDRDIKRTFKPLGAIPYDDRILRWYPVKSAVSIWAIGGRLHISFTCGEGQRTLLQSRQGETELVIRQGKWYLHAVCNIVETPEQMVDDILGIDLGVISLATDSDGQSYSGEAVEQNRRIFSHRRRNLQRNGSKSAKRKLKRLSGRQTNFQRNTNHVISKQIVAKAQDTKRAIAVEDLTGIRERTMVRRKQRARIANWSFYQLKGFIKYKAQRAGIPVIEVDPRNTSRTCPRCGYIDKANRPNQAIFLCISCGFSAPADYSAARNIRARAAVNRPMVLASMLGTSP